MPRLKKSPIVFSDDDELDLFRPDSPPKSNTGRNTPSTAHKQDAPVEVVLSDESEDDLDLSRLRSRIVKPSVDDKQPPSSHPASLRNPPEVSQKDDDEPDWVHDFSQTLPNAEERRKALASHFDDDDDDSILDLVDDETQPLATPSQPTSQPTPSQEKPAKRVKKNAAPLKSTMPLITASKLDSDVVLLQSADTNLDLSGDIGAVGRVKMKDGSLFLDIKGVVYRAQTFPCNTACVVTVEDDEARISSVLDEAVTLTVERNLFTSDEVVISGCIEDDDVNNNNNSDDMMQSVDNDEIRPAKGSDENVPSRARRKSNATKPRGGRVSKKAISKRGRSKT